jgi:hypothetical protein
MAIINNAVLTFGTNMNRTLRITIPRANTALTEVQAREAMEGMKNSNAMMGRWGFPTSVTSAQIVTTERSPIWNNA